jgi:hypothetical protein
MGLIGIGLSVCGLVFGATGWGLTRADRLTLGQGTLCVVAGLALVAGGCGLGPLAAMLDSLGVPKADGLVLLLILAAGLVLLLHQALALSRVSKQLRRLTTDRALGSERPKSEEAP